ncbi:hypothetical protein HI914_00705 [Erysiphe necator]|nr:hypothetical protein HI914_00705 [Erysiphe necator]
MHLIVSGYSEGSQVVHEATDQLSPEISNGIGAIIMFGDPMKGTPIKNYDAKKVLTVCHDGDVICDGKPEVRPPHLTYSQDANDAADFAVKTMGHIGITSYDHTFCKFCNGFHHKKPWFNPDKPSANSGEPSANPDKPSANPDKPSASPDKPSANSGESSANPDKPSANPDKPSASPDKPSANSGEPSANPDKPSASPDKPSANSGEPSANPDKPSANPDKPKRVDEQASFVLFNVKSF